MRMGTRMTIAALAAAAATLLAGAPAAPAATPPNFDLSPLAGNQAESAIAIDPSNPKRIYAVGMNATLGYGLVAARSSDGGATWTRGTVTGAEGLPLAAADPSVAFDSYGNLYLSYLSKGTKFTDVLALSTDGGATWGGKPLTYFGQNPDQPTVTTGPGATPGSASVWVTWSGYLGYLWADGAPVSGLGAVGKFEAAQALPASNGLNFGDIAVGPSGQVTVAGAPETAKAGSTIYTATSAGLGAPFSELRVAAQSGVGGHLGLPAQPHRGTDPETGLAYDRSGGPHNGRLYMMYTDSSPVESPNTQLYVRHSEDNGVSWSAPVKVNDDLGEASHFLPRLALDQTSGYLAVTWHDTRNDPLKVTTQLFGAFSTNGGESFGPNLQISAGTSNVEGSYPPPVGYPAALDYGDYTGASFDAGMLFPSWADNSNSTGENPNGALHQFDIYTAAVQGPPVNIAPTVTVELPPPSASGWYTSVPVTGTVRASALGFPTPVISSLTCSGASVGAVAGQGTPSASASLTVSAQGQGAVTCEAHDSNGSIGSSLPVQVRVDSQPPVLAPATTPAGPILLGAAVSVAPNASDPLLEGFASGLASSSCEAANTATAGAHSSACTASDLAGNKSSATANYVVGYGLTMIAPRPAASVRSGGLVTTRFALTAAGGAKIPDALAAALGCSAAVRVGAGEPVCAVYRARAHSFEAKVPVPAGTPLGLTAVKVTVTAGAATVAAGETTVRVRR